jgi:hypothetical protein
MLAPMLRRAEASLDQFIVTIIPQKVDHPGSQVEHPPRCAAFQWRELAALQLLENANLSSI